MRRFDYQDINLIPRLCIVNSRSECDTRVKLGSHVFNMPVVPANMECVINSEIAIKRSKAFLRFFKKALMVFSNAGLYSM